MDMSQIPNVIAVVVLVIATLVGVRWYAGRKRRLAKRAEREED